MISVWHTKAKYKCCWCEVTKDGIVDFSVDSWNFRDIDNMNTMWNSEISKKTTRSRKSANHMFAGQVGEPLFSIPFSNIIPCMLHVTMSIAKLLRKILLQIIGNCKEAMGALEKSLCHKDLNIKLYKSAKPEHEKMSLEQRLKKTRFSRVNSISMLKNQEIVLECLAKLEAEYTDKANRLKEVWKQALCLLAVASDPAESTKELDWKNCAKLFAKDFQKLATNSNITSYLHCFVYHIGYYLEKYSGIEKLANYSTEGNIKWIKDSLSSSTAHFGGKNSDHCWAQLLQKHYRSQISFKKTLPQDNRNKHWSSTLTASMSLTTTFPSLIDSVSCSSVPSAVSPIPSSSS